MRATVEEPTGDRTPYGNSEPSALRLGPPIIAALVLDALITLVLEVLYLPTYIGTTSLPISIAVAAVVNVLLVMAARSVTTRVGIMILPLIAWTFGFLICAVTGPGGDIMLASNLRTLLLLLCGLAPPLLYLYIRLNAGVLSR